MAAAEEDILFTVRGEPGEEGCGKEKLTEPRCYFYFLIQIQGAGPGLLHRGV